MHIGRYNRRYIVALMTRVGLAKKGTKSMKTTIPEGIVEFLELSDKDELEWRMQVADAGRMVLLQKKAGEKDTLALARFAMKQKKKRD
jgi:hypothetical protein